MCWLPCGFFFFQAEDGIRDHCVTGVQTCALPIWSSGCERWSGLTVERHSIAGFDTPEFQIPGHTLIFQLSSELVVESTIQGTYRRRSSLPCSICLFSAGTPMQVRVA